MSPASRLPHRAGGRADPLGTGLADHLADQVRPGPRLGEQAGPRQFRHRPFGAGRDHRGHGRAPAPPPGQARAAAPRSPRPGRPDTRCTTCLTRRPPRRPARPRVHTVRIRRGNGPSARHTSTGASAVSPNPLGGGVDGAGQPHSRAPGDPHPELAGTGDDRRGGPREAQGRPGREVPVHGHLVPAAPGDDVVDHERVRGQRPPPAVDRPAGQVAVPVVTGGAHDGPAVSVGWPASERGPACRPGTRPTPRWNPFRPPPRCCARRWTVHRRGPGRPHRWTSRCR